MHTCHQTGAQAPLSEDTFEKKIGTARNETYDHGNSCNQFALKMTLT